MKSRVVIVVLGVVVTGLLIDKFRGGVSRLPPSGPPPETRTIDVRDVSSYAEMVATTFRVRTTRDILPGGFSAAMAPILVDWDQSDLSDGGVITVRNLNDRGNPVSGVTCLRSARIRPNQVETAEFVMVPLGGPEAIAHAQLRFVFEAGGAEYLDKDDSVGEADVLGDLVLSWEAWRPPGVDFNMLKGMDPKNFELTLRGYSGPQRFLEDALGSRGWRVYRLQLPGGRAGLAELLRLALVLGDGAGRHSIGRMLEGAETEWLADGPDSEADGHAVEEWRKIQDIVRNGGTHPADPRMDMADKTGYQTLLRSCASMALYTVNVTVARLIEAGMPHEHMHTVEMPGIGDEEEWMSRFADTNLAGVFVRAPWAIYFVTGNPVTIPGNIPGALDRAGLLVREDGQPRRRDYSIDGETPWGHRDHLLIR